MSPSQSHDIRIGVDIGGTFTDLVGVRSDGVLFVEKVLSSTEDYSRSIAKGIEVILKRAELPAASVTEIVHATTVATNAILEGKGARTGLITTAGFRDVLDMRRHRRPDMYNLDWVKPPILVERYLRREVGERIDAHGAVIRPLDEGSVHAAIDRLVAEKVDSFAVCLINAFANPVHEQRIGQILRERLPDASISLSSDVLPEVKEYERTSTTCVNAYVRPVMQLYLASLKSRLAGMGIMAPLLTMQSNGGIISAMIACERPVNIIESGPAAGVIGGVATAMQAGASKAITFDMGGTTAKAALIEGGEASRIGSLEVGAGISSFSRLTTGGGYTIGTPSIDVAEVGVGGGSIAWLDEGRSIRVGPRSAGSNPGPVCYGLGGTEPTVTDANLVLGHLNQTHLVGGTLPVDVEAARRAIARVVAEPLGISIEDAAYGIVAVANAGMIRVIRAISSERGQDPRDAALICFGGNGPVHAVELGRQLGMRKVVVALTPGVFSAYGLLHTPIEHSYSRSTYCVLDETTRTGIEATLAELVAMAARDMQEAGYGDVRVAYRVDGDLQYRGQGSTIPTRFSDDVATLGDLNAVLGRFHDEHQRIFGYCMRSETVEVVTLRLSARIVQDRDAALRRYTLDRPHRVAAGERRRIYCGPEIGYRDAAVTTREGIGREPLAGPVIVEQYDTTIVVPPGTTISRGDDNTLTIDIATQAAASFGDERFDGVTRELVRHGLETLADEMALTLIRTCRSHHVKHTGDFSTALADAEGRLLAQGMTIPLHLGAMPDVIEAVIARYDGDIHDGDVFIMNDPFGGGMHLPDIFLVKPVFAEGRHVAFTAAIVHHLDIGGNTAGGNSPLNTETFAEGLRIPVLKLFRRGEADPSILPILLANVRVPDKVRGDIDAQLSACERGAQDYAALAARHGVAHLKRYENQLLEASEAIARDTIRAIPDGSYAFEDFLDDDGISEEPIRIAVKITIDGDHALVDCTGSAPQVAGALNATLSATKSTAYLAFRCLMPPHAATNSGYMRPITIVAPEGTVLNGSSPAAGAARAITTYRLMDALFGALGKALPGRIMAAGDGGSLLHTFSGRTPAGKPFIFVDMLRGSWGARPAADGLDGTSLALANASAVPAEVVDLEGIVRLEHWSYVPDACGAGRFRGGIGVMREYRFLADAGRLQYRSERRKFLPYGVAGGQPGTPSFVLLDPYGEPQLLPGKGEVHLRKGMVIRVCQSGGGGYGSPLDRDPEAVGRDVRDELLGIAAARDVYGVVTSAAGEVDAAATAALRARMQATQPESEEAHVLPATESDLAGIVEKAGKLMQHSAPVLLRRVRG
ncbi:hydantoinase B/oxoprolinase family protein [Bosea sp. (in: a-proteobacteria)]|uniref:hydantoinase B/oxoprolinase family protein n=1 Tax=Bosea sp. (in: a-proteobacteria) TaxID=1871050 RepID=UPI0026221597|nr:hydantoinase B/oxoprolinase family protein [Bosea sp. (in: a-proteobacteria)]MCO5091318.1 hydantoinase B/oxoprolinase family protein [Bosea sp. (in: a-proteobacteria)]